MTFKREIKVGIFVLFGLIVAGAIIFLVGDERKIFNKHYELHTTFENIAGLKPGSPVRMGGIDVGSVNEITFSTNPSDKKLYVWFTVLEDAYSRVRDNSVVSISSRGLLGDKMLEISQGSDDRPKIANKGYIQSVPLEDLQSYLAKANDLLELAKSVLENLKTVTNTAADKEVNQDVKASIAAVRKLLTDATTHDGFIHRLLTDAKMADHLDMLFVEGAKAGRSIGQTANQVNGLVTQAKEGPGLLHSLLYNKDADRLVENLAKTSDELAITLKQIRTGKGAAHELFYGDSGAKLAQDLTFLSSELRKIVADVRAGKGTVGALLTDPSVYEDLKTILGNLERNQVLRALVRYTIKQDELRSSPAVKSPTKNVQNAP